MLSHYDSRIHKILYEKFIKLTGWPVANDIVEGQIIALNIPYHEYFNLCVMKIYCRATLEEFEYLLGMDIKEGSNSQTFVIKLCNNAKLEVLKIMDRDQTGYVKKSSYYDNKANICYQGYLHQTLLNRLQFIESIQTDIVKNTIQALLRKNF